jgi:hypothetical protein
MSSTDTTFEGVYSFCNRREFDGGGTDTMCDCKMMMMMINHHYDHYVLRHLLIDRASAKWGRSTCGHWGGEGGSVPLPRPVLTWKLLELVSCLPSSMIYSHP